MLPAKPKIKRTKTAKQALESLMRLCARAERSSGDALRLMNGWEVPVTERNEVLQRLIRERYIDDERYAEAFVREKTNLSAWGEYKIRTSLRRKGIADEIINRALAQLSPEQNRERLIERLQRKAKSIKYDTTYQLKTKLIRYGASLGFAMEEVIESTNEVIRTLNQNIEECEEKFYF